MSLQHLSTWGYLINKDYEERILELQCHNVIVTNKGRRLFQITNNNNKKELTVLSYLCFLNGSWVNKRKNFASGAQITTILEREDINYIFLERNYDEIILLKQLNLDEEYIIGKKIGQGGFGVVYNIIEKASGFKSALKIQRLYPGDKKPIREAQVLPQLNHPCLIWTHEIKFINSMMYIKMEYMQGGDLSEYVNDYGPHLSTWQTKVIFYQIVEAVNYLHTNGICHRDLKPGNILLKNASPNTLIKVTDFGLAKSEIFHSPLISCVGTVQFLAPEVLNMQVKDYDKKVDVWSMGVILHLSLIGIFPEFKNKSILSWPANKFRGENYVIYTLLQGMLQKNPKNRIAVSDVREEEWLQDKQLEETVKNLVARGSSARQKIGLNQNELSAFLSGEKYWDEAFVDSMMDAMRIVPRRMSSPVTQLQEVNDVPGLGKRIVTGLVVGAILRVVLYYIYEFFNSYIMIR